MPTNPPSHVNGRFAPGNKCGQGNPLHKRMAQLRKQLVKAITPQDIFDIGEKLKAMALAGDTQAARLLLDHVLGKAPQHIELSGPEGTPLGLSLADLQVSIWESLKDAPEARAKVALALRQVALKATSLPVQNGLKELPHDADD